MGEELCGKGVTVNNDRLNEVLFERRKAAMNGWHREYALLEELAVCYRKIAELEALNSLDFSGRSAHIEEKGGGR